MDTLETEIVREETAWQEMRESWNQLLDDSVYPNIFSRWEWQTLWWKHFIRSGQLFIMVVRRGQELVGILPLYVRRRRIPLLGVFRELTPIGVGAMVCPEYLGPIIRKGWTERAAQELCASLIESGGEWDSILLDEVACDDPGTMAFAGEMAGCLPTLESQGESRYYTELPASYEQYLASLSSKNRRGKRQRLRRAQRLYCVNVSLPSAESIGTWFPHIVRLSCSSRARKRQRMPFLDPLYAHFHMELLQEFLPMHLATVLLVNYKDSPVAFTMTYSFNLKCYGFQTGMDIAAPGSPGDLAIQFTIMHMISQGIHEKDFLRGGQPYKNNYANLRRDTKTFNCFHPKRHMLFQVRRYEAKLRRMRSLIGRMIR